MIEKTMLLGAAIGDIVGSRFEFDNYRATDFDLFAGNCMMTDDTVCTVAVADWLLGDCADDLAALMRRWCLKYPDMSYGLRFNQWLHLPDMPAYNSFGNGSAMRVSPTGWVAESLQQALDLAEASAVITHNHPEGVKGAQAVAAAVFWARQGQSKMFIRDQVAQRFGYSFARSCDEIRPVYEFNETCQETVPEALTAFFESEDFEHALRLAVSLGGDSDTLAAITCSVAEAYYGVPDKIAMQARVFLPDDVAAVLDQFGVRFCAGTSRLSSK